MRFRVIAVLILVAAAAMTSGCTRSQGPDPAIGTVLTTTAPAETVTATATHQPSFTMGDVYLNTPGYTFTSEKDVVVEKFRVDYSSWGIIIKVKPLNQDPQYCWFKMAVTNEDNGKTDTYGYGRDYSVETEQWIPMYNPGPYNATMTGNRVKVWVTAAKRNP